MRFVRTVEAGELLRKAHVVQSPFRNRAKSGPGKTQFRETEECRIHSSDRLEERGALREKRRENSRADAILRHRDLVAAEMFGCVAACITFARTPVPGRSVYVRTNTRAVRYPAATLRRPFALVARLFGGSASYRLRRAYFPPPRPSLLPASIPLSLSFSATFSPRNSSGLPHPFAPFPTMSPS